MPPGNRLEFRYFIGRGSTGAAWLSSARAVGCSLQWGNERNPCRMLNCSYGTPRFYIGGKRGRRQVSMALMSRATHMLQWSRQWVAKRKRGANPIKRLLSGDWGLKLALMNAELVVIADQQCRGEYVLGSCTHRPSSQQSWGYPNLACCGGR